MVTTVTLNPAIDRTIVLEQFKYGEVNRIKTVREDMGGKGINVAKILSSLGEDVKAMGFLGQHNCSKIETLFSKESMETEFVYINASTRINTKIVDIENQITTDLNEPGFNVSEKDLDTILEALIASAKISDYVVISGSLPPGTPIDFYKTMILKIRKFTKVVLDAEGDLLLAGLEAGPAIIKPNIHELEGAVSRILSTDQEVIEAAREWISKYGLKYVLISMGSQGSLLVGNDKVLKALPIKVEVKSTVGAGDSMLAGFVYGLIHTNLEMALAYGAACGTLAVKKEGTESFTQEEVKEMLQNVQLEELT